MSMALKWDYQKFGRPWMTAEILEKTTLDIWQATTEDAMAVVSSESGLQARKRQRCLK